MSGIALHMSSPQRQKSLSEAKARGVRLKTARLLAGLDQVRAAKKLGVSRQTVSGWENGAAIEEDNLGAAAALYRAPRGWLRYGEGDAPRGLLAEVERERLTRPDE
jgi:transcriptional regulator with XRE-family HTH domain